MSRKLATTVYLTEEQYRALKALSERTRVPVAAFVREGIDLGIRSAEQSIAAGIVPVFDEPAPSPEAPKP